MFHANFIAFKVLQGVMAAQALDRQEKTQSENDQPRDQQEDEWKALCEAAEHFGKLGTRN